MDILTKYTKQERKDHSIRFIYRLIELGCYSLAKAEMDFMGFDEPEFINESKEYQKDQLIEAKKERDKQERRISMFNKLISLHD